MTSKTNRRALLAGAAATGALAALPAVAGKNGALHEITIKRFRFSPATLEVRPGDRIRWTNRDGAPHDATATDRAWKTPVMRRNQSAEITVTADMSTTYFCSIHPQMKANFVILTA